MLQIPGPLCGDKRANEIINGYMNQRLVALMTDIIADFDEDTIEQNPEFAEEIFFLFPENYEKEKQPKLFMKLYHLLKAEDEFAPEQMMEYVLAQILYLYKDLEESIQPMMPERAYVLEKLIEDFEADGDKQAENDAAEYLSQLENPAEYLDLIFWDMDFALLDEYQEEDLARSNPEIAKNANFEEK